MKKLLLTLLAGLTLNFSQAQARALEGEEDVKVSAGLVEGYAAIPRLGPFNGSVISVYFGSAFGLHTYVVTVGNSDAPCEGDDCLIQRTFTLTGYKGIANKVYSRKIDKNTYSIAILTSVVKGQADSGELIMKKAKLVLRVKFTATGIEQVAEVKTIYL